MLAHSVSRTRFAFGKGRDMNTYHQAEAEVEESGLACATPHVCTTRILIGLHVGVASARRLRPKRAFVEVQ